jgi:pimeloyl-ACP methyl ester carboxylesterase
LKRYPQVGQSFDIGGRSLNIFCSGEGSPTVILEGNWGSPGYSWTYIQRAMAKFTHTCWYDRAGYGWSDPGPFPNHSDSIARDLHKLLTAACIRPSYVLVGHAMGGFHVRVFQGFYPSEVAGMVLVDPMNEDMTIHIHNHIEAFRPMVIFINRTLGRLGVTRLMAPDPGLPQAGLPQGGLTAREWTIMVALIWQAKSLPAQTKEPPLWVNGELARASRDKLHDLPLLVLSAGIPGKVEDPKLEDLKRTQELHAELARLSMKGRRRIVTNSSHRMIFEAPGSITEAARQIIGEARREQRRVGRSPEASAKSDRGTRNR